MTVLSALRWTDLVDIALVSVLAWAAIAWIRRSRARPALAGLAMMGLVYLVARRLGLALTASILQGFFAVLVLVLVVVFQDELRRIFERIGVLGLGRRREVPADDEVDVVVRAVAYLAAARSGALLVLPGREPIERHLEGGMTLDALLCEPLLLSLFDPHSPGHDGAVVLRGGRVERFAVHLPLSSDRERLGVRGTRHAAALGLSERTDALVVVVSEERGTITLALDGELAEVAEGAELGERIRRFVARVSPPLPERRRGRWRALGVRWPEALAAVALAAAAWLFNAAGADRSEAVRSVPVVVENLPAGWQLDAVEPERVDVVVAGPRHRLLFGTAEPTVRVDADLVRLGRRTFNLDPAQVEAPPDVEVRDVRPRQVRLAVRGPAGDG